MSDTQAVHSRPFLRVGFSFALGCALLASSLFAQDAPAPPPAPAPGSNTAPENKTPVATNSAENTKDKAAAPSPPPQPQAIQLTFPDDVELKTVIDYIASRLQINILYDDAVAKQRITLRTPDPVASGQLLPLLRSALKFRNLALIEGERAGWLTVVPADKLLQESTWSDANPSVSTGKDAHRIASRVIELKHTSAADFAALVQPFLTKPGGNLVALPDGHTLVLTDYDRVAETVLRLRDLVDTSDVDRSWQLHPLKFAPPTAVVTIAQGLLNKIAPAGGKADSKTPGDTAATLFPMPGQNAVLITGNRKQIEDAEKILNLLDTPSNLQTHIYRLQYTGTDRATLILKQMLQPMEGTGGGTGTCTIIPDLEANALVVTCPEDQHGRIQKWLTEIIDKPSDSTPTGLTTRVFTIRYARAQELAQTLQSVFSGGMAGPDITLDTGDGTPAPADNKPTPPPGINPPPKTPAAETSIPKSKSKSPISLFSPAADDSQLHLTVDVPTNSIICTGPAAILSQAERLIERLDHHRPQVLVDVIIVSVTKSNTIDLGVEVAYLKNKDGQLSEGILSSFGLLNLNAAAGTAAATLGPGLNAVLLRSDAVSVMVRALQTKLKGQIVAHPRLLVADNATGTLNSINEQPYTSINSANTVSTTSFGGYAEAGTEISLTPHISESDIVNLEYTIRSSSFTGSSSDPGIPPPRATDSVNSHVTIPSGYTLLVGGLTRKNYQETHKQVPFIGDVPIIGELLKSRNDTESESVLYVFLRPIIHREDRFAYLKYVSDQTLAEADLQPAAPALEMEMIP